MALDLEVQTQPQYADLLEEVKALHQMVVAVSAQHAIDVDEVIAYLAVNELSDRVSMPAEASLPDEKIQELLTEPGLAERYAQIKQKLVAMTINHDPVAQFEALSGHQFVAVESSRRRDRAPRPGLLDRSGIMQRRKSWVVASVTATLVCLLFIYNNRTASLAYLSAAELEASRPSNLRSLVLHDRASRTPEVIARGEDYMVSLFEAALLYTNAQQRYFFVHYTYDPALLAQAEHQLVRLSNVDRVPDELVAEVRFLLAKVYLAGDKKEEARTQLLLVQRHAGAKSSEAERLLAKLW